MTSKHTPGPWSCIDEGRLDDCVHSDAGEHVEGDIICLSPILEGYEVSAENWEANARLIAAAPESHEANQLFVQAINEMQRITADQSDEYIYDDMPSSKLAIAYFAARAAIAKATGAA